MKFTFTVVAALVLLSAATVTRAHDSGTEDSAVAARHAIMSYLGAQMRTLGAMSQGRMEFDQGYSKSVGDAIAAMSLAIPYVFPEGSDSVQGTKASPSIFSNWESFLEASAQLRASAGKVGSATSADSLASAFQELAGTCSSCHMRFRLR